MATERARVFEGLAAVPCGDVLVVLWEVAATTRRLGWMFDQYEALIAQQPSGAMLLQLITSSATPPDSSARALSQTRLRALGAGARRMVSIPLGDTIWTAIVRTVMRGLAMVGGQSKVHLVASNEREGVDLVLQTAAPSTPTRAELSAAIDELYRALNLPRSKSASAAR